MAILLYTKKGKVKAHNWAKVPNGRGLYQFPQHESCIGVLLLFPGRVTSPSQGYPPAKCCQYPFIHPGEERQSEVKFLVYKGNNTTGEPGTSRSRVRDVDRSAIHASPYIIHALFSNLIFIVHCLYLRFSLYWKLLVML